MFCVFNDRTKTLRQLPILTSGKFAALYVAKASHHVVAW